MSSQPEWHTCAGKTPPATCDSALCFLLYSAFEGGAHHSDHQSILPRLHLTAGPYLISLCLHPKKYEVYFLPAPGHFPRPSEGLTGSQMLQTLQPNSQTPEELSITPASLGLLDFTKLHIVHICGYEVHVYLVRSEICKINQQKLWQSQIC